MEPEQRKLLNPRTFRQQNVVEVDLLDGHYVKCRKEDMTVLVLEGRVPMPMLAAVQKMIEMPNASPVERIEALGSDHGRELVHVLQEHCCRVSLIPKIVMEETGNPDHLLVDFLDTQKLMLIWNATAIIPRVSTAAAAFFRSGAGADDADVPPNVEAVRPTTAHVGGGDAAAAGLKPPVDGIRGLEVQRNSTPDVEFISAG